MIHRRNKKSLFINITRKWHQVLLRNFVKQNLDPIFSDKVLHNREKVN